MNIGIPKEIKLTNTGYRCLRLAFANLSDAVTTFS